MNRSSPRRGSRRCHRDHLHRPPISPDGDAELPMGMGVGDGPAVDHLANGRQWQGPRLILSGTSSKPPNTPHAPRRFRANQRQSLETIRTISPQRPGNDRRWMGLWQPEDLLHYVTLVQMPSVRSYLSHRKPRERRRFEGFGIHKMSQISFQALW